MSLQGIMPGLGKHLLQVEPSETAAMMNIERYQIIPCGTFFYKGYQ